MATLYDWTPTTSDDNSPLVIANSKGNVWTESRIASAEYNGDHAAAIQAAIEDLSNQACPVMGESNYNFEPPRYEPSDGYAPACADDPNHSFAPCQADASDWEINYIEVPVLDASSPAPFAGGDQIWSGTVWIYRPITLNHPLRARRGCTLDFLNNLVTMVADETFVSVGQGADNCSHSCVRNVRVQAHAAQTQPIIRLNALPGGLFKKPNGEYQPERRYGHVFYNSFENITINGTTAPGCFDGIHIDSSGGILPAGVAKDDDPEELWDSNHSHWNTFRNIRMTNVRRGIFFEKATWNTGYNNGNVFSNVYVDGFRRLVEFKTCLWCTNTDQDIVARMGEAYLNNFSGMQPDLFNVFQHVGGSPTPGITTGGFFNIYGTGNRLEHVGFPTWDSSPEHEFSVQLHRTGGREETNGPQYLCAYRLHDHATVASSGLFYIDMPDPPDGPSQRFFADPSSSPGCSETISIQVDSGHSRPGHSRGGS